jgi:crotonobetainyl-CoA:carnitine CoA-transferase CaiB-like acyl-CoA transferase
MSGLMAGKIQGIGQHIDVSITEELLTIIDRRGPWLLASQYTGDIDKRLPPGTSLVGGCPDGIYPCKDGYWDLIGGVMWWPNIFKMLGEPAELADPRYGTAEGQQDPERQAEILSVFMPWSLSHTKEEATNAALEARECAAPLYNVADLLTNPHLVDRGYFVDIDHPVAGTLKYTGAPFSPEKTPWQVRRPAPLLGEHNREVLGSLGFSGQDITRMRSSGII